MSRTLRILFITIILTFCAYETDGKDGLSYKGISHRVTAELHPAYNLLTHYFYRGNNPSGKVLGPSGSIHMKYSFGHNGTYQGVGLSVNDFRTSKVMGNPVALYIFQGVRLADLSPKWSFGYEWNLGFSYGWKQNDVINSKGNIYINVALPLTWRPSSAWEVHIGPEYTHFSNGDTCYPNGGANPVGFRLGASRVFGQSNDRSIGKDMFSCEPSLDGSGFMTRVHYDILLYGAWRAGRIIDGYNFNLINKPFALGGVNINPKYRINRYFSAGPSLDVQTDTSSGLYAPVVSEETDELISYSKPSTWEQTSVGASMRGEIEMPFFSINIGLGYNILRNGTDVKRFYTTYNLKSFISDRIFICMGYRLSAVQYTHNLMFGLGVRL